VNLSYQQTVAGPDIIVADTLLQESNIENEILVAIKMPLPLSRIFPMRAYLNGWFVFVVKEP
jgi:hypothetical protein